LRFRNYAFARERNKSCALANYDAVNRLAKVDAVSLLDIALLVAAVALAAKAFGTI